MEESVSDQIVALEDKIIFLMTSVSISPFLGLFGTVWGIMLAFTEMAQAGKPDISTLAPGISGALLTTVLGLVVAIPSLIGYNYITFYIKQITVFMDNFVEETLAKYEMERVIADRKEAESAAAPDDDTIFRQQPAQAAQQSLKQDPRNNRFF
jgi:biopolymer transport protein TolQ